MASSSFALLIRPRGKPLNSLPNEVSLPVHASAADLYTAIATNARSSVHRLRITKGSDGSLVPNSQSLALASTGLRNQSSIYVKDLGESPAPILPRCSPPESLPPLPSPRWIITFSLPWVEYPGPQVPWRTVFLVEYLGPLIIHPLLYARLSAPSTLQTLSLAFITLHFFKRELETLFVHRFSAATMPLFNIFKNSAHYWLLAGLNLAFWIYRPNSPTANSSNPYITYPAVLLYAVGELGNFHAHVTLRNLRRAGSTDRGIPHGGAFELVTCPNYMYEVLIWTAVGMVTWSWSAVLFALVAIGQMGVWAQKKEIKYRREFGDKYHKKRWVIIPGIW